MADRAVRFVAREQAELAAYERDPKPIGPEELAGPTVATLISAGTELALYQGHHHAAQFPMSPGYAAVFRAEEVGGEAAGFRVGDPVFCLGPHASYQRVHRSGALRVPEGLPAQEALFARMMGISMSTLTTTTARPPGKVLVTGLGPVGHLAARVLALCGYEVHACDPDPQRRAIAEAAGLRRVYPAVPVDDPAVAGQVDLVLECSGREEPTLEGCRVVRKRGEVVLVGVPWQRTSELSAHELLHAVFHQYAVVRSGWEWEVPRLPTDFRVNSLYGNMAAALEWLAEGRLKVGELCHVASCRDPQAVFQDLLNRRMERLVVVLDWSDRV